MTGDDGVDYWDHWYEVVDEPPPERELRQGDILRDVTPAWLPDDLEIDEEEDPDLETKVHFGAPETRIVLTASCDLDARSFPHLLLAPIRTADKENVGPDLSDKYLERRLEALRRNLLPRQFMLSEFPDMDFPRSFVMWQDLVYLPRAYVLRAVEGPRLRLRHPFRERFGAWVGQRMSDVGPENEAQIPKYPKNPQTHDIVDAVTDLDEEE